jgi:hypothetical protein
MDAGVIEIIEPMQERTAKSGKKYKAMKVKLSLDNGEDANVFSFEELEIGSAVKVKKNGEYWNIDTPPKAKSVDLEPVLKALKFIAEQNKEIIRLIKGEDEIVPVNDEPLNLDEYPY